MLRPHEEAAAATEGDAEVDEADAPTADHRGHHQPHRPRGTRSLHRVTLRREDAGEAAVDGEPGVVNESNPPESKRVVRRDMIESHIRDSALLAGSRGGSLARTSCGGETCWSPDTHDLQHRHRLILQERRFHRK